MMLKEIIRNKRIVARALQLYVQFTRYGYY